ncbi:MAG: VWA domain-containing protein, partial [Planctomycetes bacterium]|nr:VWA domain-containing protein [Planctomycetota bacterium]
MTLLSLPLLAEGGPRVFLDWGRIDTNADFMLPLVVVLALDVLARWIIRLDTRELPRLVGWTLTALRIGTISCLGLIYLQPEWRSEREVVQNSRVLLLVDTSSSMGIADVEASPDSGGSSRADAVARVLEETDFLDDLGKTHDVVVLRFDEELHRLASLEKATGDTPDSGGRPRTERSETEVSRFEDWRAAFTPSGAQTRLGEALRELIHGERGSPISAVVVFSDGGQNAGIGPEAAIDAARAAKVPVHAVGVGSQRRALNVRVYKLEVPPQAYPNDPYSVTGLIQAYGLAGESVTAELLVRDAEEGDVAPEPGSGVVVRREEVVLGGDGEATPVVFELTPTATGRRTISLRVRSPEADSDPKDDYQEEGIAIVDRKTRVLLFAGGPTREYRFLRTLLYRDAQTTVDVLLGTRQAGISQEADRILDEFPATAEEMFSYDCVVAFDPDWQKLIAPQVDLLERWVGE